MTRPTAELKFWINVILFFTFFFFWIAFNIKISFLYFFFFFNTAIVTLFWQVYRNHHCGFVCFSFSQWLGGRWSKIFFCNKAETVTLTSFPFTCSLYCDQWVFNIAYIPCWNDGFCQVAVIQVTGKLLSSNHTDSLFLCFWFRWDHLIEL